MIRACFRSTAIRPSAPAIRMSSASAAVQTRGRGAAAADSGSATGCESGTSANEGARAARSDDRPATARGDGLASATRRAWRADVACELFGERSVAFSARGCRRPRPARTIRSPEATSGLEDATTSSRPASPTGSGTATAGSAPHVGAAGAAGSAGCEVAAAGGGAGCSARGWGGAGCGCTGGGDAAGAGAGTTTRGRSGRNASGSR